MYKNLEICKPRFSRSGIKFTVIYQGGKFTAMDVSTGFFVDWLAFSAKVKELFCFTFTTKHLSFPT